jgi:Uncharacterized protein family UPF0029
MNESFDRALADMEILSAAYPDETVVSNEGTANFPLHVTLYLSETAHIELELVDGYPVHSNIQISSYRSAPSEKARMGEVLKAIRTIADECRREGVEGGLSCCAASLQAWNDHGDDQILRKKSPQQGPELVLPLPKEFSWIQGEPLLDRKSTFQAHVCRVSSEADVREALHALLDENSKLQRATHNMVNVRTAGSLGVHDLSWAHFHYQRFHLSSTLTDSRSACPMWTS